MKPTNATTTDYIVTQDKATIGTFAERVDAVNFVQWARKHGWKGLAVYSRVTCTETIYQEV